MPSSEDVEAVSESLDETPLLWLLRSFLRVSSSTSSEKNNLKNFVKSRNKFVEPEKFETVVIEFLIDFGISDRSRNSKFGFWKCRGEMGF